MNRTMDSVPFSEMTNPTLKALLAECRGYEGTSPSESLIAQSRQLLALAKKDPSILGVAASELTSLPLAGAAWLALLIGQAVEISGGAEYSCRGILEVFFASLEKAAMLKEQRKSKAGAREEERELDTALQILCPSVVAHLARMPGERERLAHDEALMDKLDALASSHVGIAWVLEALQRSSGDLVALHIESARGFMLRYENVANGFHLFSLFQAAIGTRLPGGKVPNPDVVAEARGAGQKPVRDAAWWHYGDPRSAKAELMASIWGEASVRSIPFVNGTQLMLLWPPILNGRGWESSFFGHHLEALPASVSIRHELSVEEARSWLDAVGIHGESPSAQAASSNQSSLSRSSAKRWWRRLLGRT